MNSWTAGDATISGILLTIAYLLCAALCWRGAKRSAVSPDVGVKAVELARTRRQFWIGAAILLLALGLERQLNLLGLVTDHGRAWLVRGDVYDERRAFQLPLILGIAGTGGVGLAVALIAHRRAGWPIALALTGLAFLLTFVVVRAVSFHDVDGWLHRPWLGIAATHLIEMGGIALTAVAAFAFSAAVEGEHRVERLRARSIEERRRRVRDERRAARKEMAG